MTLANGRSVCVWIILPEKQARFHAKNSGKIHDLLLSCGSGKPSLAKLATTRHLQ